MKKKVSIEESSAIFDLAAFKLLISVVAISLASMMSRASTVPKPVFSPRETVMLETKGQLPLLTTRSEAEHALNKRPSKFYFAEISNTLSRFATIRKSWNYARNLVFNNQ